MSSRSALFLFVAACGGASMPSAEAPPSSTASPPSTAPALRVRARVPEHLPSTGVVTVVALDAQALESNLIADVSRFDELLQCIRVLGPRDVHAGHVEFELAGTRPAALQVIYDPSGLGFDALFGNGALASGDARVPSDAASLELVLHAGRPSGEEGCGRSPREELVVFEAPETRRRGDDGTRRLCVYLPPSYETNTERRYPVIFALPGYSGSHYSGDAFLARAALDDVSEGQEAILVGVDTRMPEGPSYFARSERYGDWRAYFGRVIDEVDARFRTLPRRGVIGHSTGGWNAVQAARIEPERIHAVASSSPDALDFDTWWLADPQTVKPWLCTWARVEAAMGGRGQMVSYSANWSPRATGFAWPLDLQSCALRPDVYAEWQAQSPAHALQSDEGRAAFARLSGRMIFTAGRNDEFGLFEPTASFVRALQDQGVEAEWRPTELGHFGEASERFGRLYAFLLEQLDAE
ncbi:MAG: alpha/beta hydrolase-fold protein [Myxococcota bacterium]